MKSTPYDNTLGLVLLLHTILGTFDNSFRLGLRNKFCVVISWIQTSDKIVLEMWFVSFGDW